jgi:hypothetical protein
MAQRGERIMESMLLVAPMLAFPPVSTGAVVGLAVIITVVDMALHQILKAATPELYMVRDKAEAILAL